MKPFEVYEIEDLPEKLPAVFETEQIVKLLGGIVIIKEARLVAQSTQILDRWRELGITFGAYSELNKIVLVEKVIPQPKDDYLAPTIRHLRTEGSDTRRMTRPENPVLVESRLSCSADEIERMLVPTFFGKNSRIFLPTHEQIRRWAQAFDPYLSESWEWFRDRIAIYNLYGNSSQVKRADHYSHPENVTFRLVAELQVEVLRNTSPAISFEASPLT